MFLELENIGAEKGLEFMCSVDGKFIAHAIILPLGALNRHDKLIIAHINDKPQCDLRIVFSTTLQYSYPLVRALMKTCLPSLFSSKLLILHRKELRFKDLNIYQVI